MRSQPRTKRCRASSRACRRASKNSNRAEERPMKLRIAARGRDVIALAGLAMAMFPLALAAAGETRHHYEITGGLIAATDSSVATAPAHFSASAARVTQSSDHFELSARLAAAPDGCASDTIFQNGFDP